MNWTKVLDKLGERDIVIFQEWCDEWMVYVGLQEEGVVHELVVTPDEIPAAIYKLLGLKTENEHETPTA